MSGYLASCFAVSSLATEYSLSEGKSMTDRVLAKEEVRIPLGHRSIEEEQDFVTRLQEIGVRASIAS
jgi:hypothetical protein